MIETCKCNSTKVNVAHRNREKKSHTCAHWNSSIVLFVYHSASIRRSQVNFSQFFIYNCNSGTSTSTTVYVCIIGAIMQIWVRQFLTIHYTKNLCTETPHAFAWWIGHIWGIRERFSFSSGMQTSSQKIYVIVIAVYKYCSLSQFSIHKNHRKWENENISESWMWICSASHKII